MKAAFLLGLLTVQAALAVLPSQEYDVLILGGGLSGMNTARELVTKHGFDPSKVAVIEAKNRIGGRTFSQHTETLRGEPTRRDLGAEFVSPHQRRLNGLLDEFGIKKAPVFLNGRSVFQHNSGELHFSSWDLPIDGLAKLCLMKGFAQLAWYARDINTEEVWNSDSAAWYDERTVHDFAMDIFGYDAARRVFETLMSVMYGSDTKDMPLLHLLYFIKSTGGLSSLRTSGDFHVVNGTQQVSEGIRRSIPNVHVELSSPVLAVDWSDSGATVTTQPDGGDAYQVRAKRIVNTLPAPLAHTVKYNPPVPKGRSDFTSHTSMGRYTKVHVRCPNRFWTDNDLLKMAISYPGPLVTFVDGSYEKGLGDEGMIVGFILGKFSDHWLSLSEEEREQNVKLQLHEVLDKPGDANRFNDCAYGEYHWEKDPHARGVTVNLQRNLLSNPEIAAAIKKPFGAVHLGGTETSSEWHGYMEGALASGERVAAEVAASLSESSPNLRVRSVSAEDAKPTLGEMDLDPMGLGMTPAEEAEIRAMLLELSAKVI